MYGTFPQPTSPSRERPISRVGRLRSFSPTQRSALVALSTKRSVCAGRWVSALAEEPDHASVARFLEARATCNRGHPLASGHFSENRRFRPFSATQCSALVPLTTTRSACARRAASALAVGPDHVSVVRSVEARAPCNRGHPLASGQSGKIPRRKII